MNRFLTLLITCLAISVSHIKAAPVDPSEADSQAIRDIQELDQSQLDFDFFEDNSTSGTNNNQSSEAALLEALELLEQSPEEEPHFEKDILESLKTSSGLSTDDNELSSEMDEEIESSLDQDISDELQDALEGLFDEE